MLVTPFRDKMSSDLVKASAEKELAETKQKVKDSIDKKMVAKALYYPSFIDPYLNYEKVLRQDDGSEPVEVVVVKKTSKEQDQIIPEDSLKEIPGFRKRRLERRISMNDLMHLGDATHTNTDVLIKTSMELLESMEKEKIIVILRDRQEIHQNFRLTEDQYAAFLSAIRVETSVYKVVSQQLSSKLPKARKE
jgi:hypothetical protein